MWVCRTKEELVEAYIQYREDMDPEDFDYNELFFSEAVIIADNDEEGLLLAYKDEPQVKYC